MNEIVLFSSQRLAHGFRLITGMSNSVNDTIIMERSLPCETNNRSADQEFNRFLRNLKVQCQIHNNQMFDPFKSQINLIHNLAASLFKSHFNIIILSMSRSPSVLSSAFLTFLDIPHFSVCATIPVHVILVDVLIIISGEE